MQGEFKRGEVYWYDFSFDREGSEINGCRPCVIVSNNSCNEHSPIVTVVPITSKIHRKPIPTHVRLFVRCPSLALCESITSVSKSRFGEYICTLTYAEMLRVEDCIKIQLSLGV